MGPVVCKIHLEKIDDQERMAQINRDIGLIKSTFGQLRHPNIIQFDQVENYENRATIAVRQFICHNLQEKMQRIPSISLIEGHWIIFQILAGLAQIHQEK